MDFKFSDEQRMLEETVGRLVRDSYTFDARNKALESEHGFSTDTWTQFAELGLLGVPFSEEAGGFNGGGPELMVVAEGFGRGLVVEPYLATVVLSVASWTFASAWRLRSSGESNALMRFGPYRRCGRR